jgi:hypothetical protein
MTNQTKTRRKKRTNAQNHKKYQNYPIMSVRRNEMRNLIILVDIGDVIRQSFDEGG